MMAENSAEDGADEAEYRFSSALRLKFYEIYFIENIAALCSSEGRQHRARRSDTLRLACNHPQ